MHTAILSMALLCGQLALLSGSDPTEGSQVIGAERASLSPNRITVDSPSVLRTTSSRDKVAEDTYRGALGRVQFFSRMMLCGIIFLTVVFMFQPPQGGGGAQTNMRMPPRWEPSMEATLPFRTWMQDLMLWTIVTDLTAPQQTAAIISQLGGPARKLARTLTPDEVYNGGVVNGQRLDPVSFLLHGLSARFAPLDEENRLRAAQDLLSFARRQGESIDSLISRFDITRSLARQEGGGALSIETASLILLRSCGVSSEQFQTLTQPFGLRLPSTEPEYSQLCHHLRRMAHIVERHPNNIASGLRQQAHFSQAFMTEADTGSSYSADPWDNSGAASAFDAPPGFGPSAATDWAFAANTFNADGSGTDSETSSDHDEPLPVEDLQGMTNGQADEYLFGQYQQAKKRWRRYTGKPVRSLRRVLKRKGKGKGKRNSYLNLDSLLQQSSYFRGKGKGGKSSGKGFGRKQNPCGRDGEPLRCSICGSAYHLRARCDRRDQAGSSGATGSQPQRQAPAFTVEPAAPAGGLHFAAFESESSSWVPVSPRSITSSRHESLHTETSRRAQHPSSSAGYPAGNAATASAEHHSMTPDPWMTQADPWMQWLHDDAPLANEPRAEVPTARLPRTHTDSGWFVPGLGDVGVQQSFSESLGFAPSTPPPPLPSNMQARDGVNAPDWFQSVQRAMSQIQTANAASRGEARSSIHGTGSAESSAGALPSIFAAHSGLIANPASQWNEVGSIFAPPSGPTIFSQVQSLRRAPTAADRRPAQEDARPFQGHGSSCVVCLDEFTAGDDVCRMSCGHTYHCICIGELAAQVGAEFDDNGNVSVVCPSCRAQVHVARSWRYPDLTRAASSEHSQTQPQEATEPEEPPSTPEARSRDPEEFMSPEEQAFPWWPVPSHELEPEASQSTTAYHSNVRLPDGRIGLLVDPGSYGNLVGADWLREASARMQGTPSFKQRPSPLQVGGVGKGAQLCQSDCVMPIVLTRQDGSVTSGTFTSPVVSQSGCPALLGLKTLADNRAILDLGKNQLHFLGPGEPAMVLPPGSETFQLESAMSGHLLLPCTASVAATEGEHHLFADNDVEHHWANPCPDQIIAEEQECAEALHSRNYEVAVEALRKIVNRWSQRSGAPPEGRFSDQGGFSVCFGAYTHGGQQGLTQVTKGRPNMTRLLAMMVTDKVPNQKFSSMMLIVNASAPVHTDKYNSGHNILLPVTVPANGGGLWLELRTGDTVTGQVQIRDGSSGPVAGQAIPLSAGQPAVFDPKTKHATELWSRGARVVIAAFTTGGAAKLPESEVLELVDLGLPVDDEGLLSSSATVESTGVSAVQSLQHAMHGQAAQGLHSSARESDIEQCQPARASTSSTTSSSVARSSRRRLAPKTMGFIRRVLLISIFHSTAAAFLDCQWEVPTQTA